MSAPVPDERRAVLGVDGCRGLWVAARVAGDERSAVLLGWGHGPFAALVDSGAVADAVVAVDIPVGLPAKGRRDCDVAGRRALGAAASRLFLAPPAAAYAAPDLAAANAALRAAGEPGVSAQAFALRTAVLEVAAFVEAAAAPPERPRVVEVHPELSFLARTGDVLAPKRTAAGVARRIAALSGWLDVVDALGRAPAGVPVDDALDALAAAWTATRVRDGGAVGYPRDAERGAPVIRA